MMFVKSLILLFLFAGTAQAATDDATLRAILQDHWQQAQQEQIFFRKDPDAFRMQGKLPDVSQAGRDRRQAFNEKILARLKKIDVNTLSTRDQVNWHLFKYERQIEAQSYAQLDHYYPLHYYSNWFSYFAGAPNNMVFLNSDDFDRYLISLADFPRYNRQFLHNLQQAIEAGHTHYCESLPGYEKRISKHIVEKVSDSVFYAPLDNLSDSLTHAQRQYYRHEVSRLIKTVLVPEYKKIYAFFTQTYMPACRKQVGITALDGGDEYYQYLIRYYTTTDYSADEIFQLGISEVARIRAEMQEVIKQTGFQGSFKAFIHHLRTNPRFYTNDARDLLEKTSYITVKMAAQLPKWFGLLPRNRFDIKPSPDGGAYYVGADGSGASTGTYFIDTQDLASQPLFNLEALTFHEAEPGHHLQSAIAQEQDVPEFRKTLYHSAYGEGWGLYAEVLGKEMGFYQDPHSDFGRLTYEMWRACRLVVDTGLHAKGWTRQQAIDYLAENTALSKADVTRQIDRYITWPGQALSYKIGELKIRELRQTAEQTLGKHFDIRTFHDQILKNGSLPLDILETLFRQWLVQQQAAIQQSK